MKKLMLALSVALFIAMLVLNLTYDDAPQPDVVYEMANKHIEWHYAGK